MAKKKAAADKQKHPGGRPTDYKPEYCEQVIELGRLGRSKAQIAREFNVVRQTLDNWATEHKEFFNALTQARELALAAWEDKADAGIEMQGFNHGLWGRIMSARFPDDYRENSRHELTGKDGAPLQAPTIFIVADDETE